MSRDHRLFQEERTVNQDNRTIIRVWLPKVAGRETALTAAAVSKAYKGLDVNVGHVSIETRGTYASLWPREGVTGLFQVVAPRFHSAAEDEEAESGVADLIVCLYSLKTEEMIKAFDDVKQTGLGYVLMRGTKVSVTSEDAKSCAALAYDLLKIGGIWRLEAGGASTMSSVVTPIDLANIVKKAKKAELKQYPETAGYERFEKEYTAAEARKRCVLM